MRELGFVGQLAPFFLKRVFHMELHGRIASNPLKRWIRLLVRPGKRLFAKLFGDSAFIEMQVCNACSFVQATHPFPEEAIMRLYLDYRAESYNTERIRYEPTYRALANRVGIDDVEIQVRVKAATEWLADKVDVSQDFTMLDFGGADGRFLPQLPARKFVYEVSSIDPLPGITRIAQEDGLGSYSYVHLAHVLEHVVDPLKLVQRLVPRIKLGGYLYIEVPQEMSDSQLKSLQNGTSEVDIPVHEHINKYSVPALVHLLQSAGLELVASRADQIDAGWAQAVHLRALGKRVS